MAKKKIDLSMPDWYMDIPEVERLKGKCGAGSGIGEKIVPETIWGMRYTDVCQIHDMEYSPEWNPEIQKALMIDNAQNKEITLNAIRGNADRRFLDNILKKINWYSANTFMKWLRRRRAYTSYDIVAVVGRSVFWNGIREYENLDIST